MENFREGKEDVMFLPRFYCSILNEIFHFFLAITSSEGTQRTFPPEIKSVNFSTASIGFVTKLRKELPSGKTRGNPCNLRNLWIKLPPERLAL